MIPLWGKKQEKQNSAAIMTYVVGKGMFLQWSWNYKGKRLKKHQKRQILKRSNEFNWYKSPD